MITALVLCGCGRLQDDFRGDTDAGRIQLDVERVENVDLDDVTQLRLRPRERAYEQVLTKRLPVGAKVTVSARIAKFGVYRRGAGWIFAGQRFLGRYGVWATVLEATSDDPDRVSVRVETMPDRPVQTRLVLSAVRPGTARVSLAVQPLDGAGQPVANPRVVDTLSITIQ